MTTTTDRGTVLGQETALAGRVAAQELTVLGRFDGTLDIKGLLRIGPDGRVKAVVHAGAVEIHGTFEGEIDAGSLVFAETARAQGAFRSPRLTVREGARVEGGVNLSREAAKAEAAAAPAKASQPVAPSAPAPAAAAPETASQSAATHDAAEAAEAEPAAQAPGTSAPHP